MSDRAPVSRAVSDAVDGLLIDDAERQYLFFGTIVFDEDEWDRERESAEQAA